MDSFEVKRVVMSDPSCLSSPSPGSNIKHELEHDPAGVSVSVQFARLDTSSGQLSAEVDGHKVHADVLMHTQGAADVLAMWVDGKAYELRFPHPTWSKDMKGMLLASGDRYTDVDTPHMVTP